MELQEIVYIRRIPFKRLPFDVYRESMQDIGSFIDKNTRQTFRCLTKQEEALILPQFVDVDSKDTTFTGKIMEFYADISIKIPPADNEKEQWSSGGLKLNIKCDENGMPNAPLDYIYYKHALQAPRVAKSLNEAKENPSNYDYFIVDLVSEQRAKAANLLVYNKAMTAFLKITSSTDVDMKHVNVLLRVLKNYLKHDLILAELSDADKLDELRKVATNNPDKFYEAATDENIAEMSLVLEAIDKAMFTKVNGKFYYGEIELGKTPLDVVKSLLKPSMSGELLEIKANLSGLE